MRHFLNVDCILLLVVFFLLFSTSSTYPIDSNDVDSLPSQHAHHHHHKHHIRHKHHRRSLTSEEDTKTQRNKQIMLTKPYWPWP